MYLLSQDFQLIADLSDDPFIPGNMNWGTVVIHRGKVYAVGCRKFDNKLGYRVERFDGEGWVFV